MQSTDHIYQRLRIVCIVALVDLVLLIILVSAALSGEKDLVHILGPLHGINFLLLLVIVGVAAIDGLWGWWFPVIILLTAGPPGAFLGEWLLHRQARAQNRVAHDTLSSEITMETAMKETNGSDSSLLSTSEKAWKIQKELR